MKKILTGFICVLIMLPCCVVYASAAFVPEKTEIVLAEHADEAQERAAEVLADGIAAVTGDKVSIVGEGAASAEYRIFVGGAEKTTDVTNGLADGSYHIKSIENGIEITGAGERGTLYGVYRFLEEFAGCRYFDSEQSIQSNTGRLEIPASVNISYTPFFEYAHTDWHIENNDVFPFANGLNANEPKGNVSYISRFCHTLTTQFCASKTYFGEHPEYFALHDGKRVPDQLCLTNEDVYKLVEQEVFDLLKEKHDPDAPLQIISLTQHDNTFYCTCDKCAALDNENGSQSGTMITFVNRIARAVRDAGYKNVAIDTFAYQYTRKAPTKVVPEDNVIVRLCSLECCFSHTLDDASCTLNAAFMNDLTAWSKLCSHVYIWDYTANYTCLMGIFPDFAVLQKNVQIFYEHGVKGVFEEGLSTKINYEFAKMRTYLIARLLQNPYCDYRNEMLAFADTYYGEGGGKIVEIIDILSENAAKQHNEIYKNMTDCFSLTQQQADTIDRLWQEAKGLCKNEETHANITLSEISWRYVKSSLKLSEFNGLKKVKANKALYSDILALGVDSLSIRTNDIAVSKNYAFLPAQDWQDGYSTVAKPLYILAWALYVVFLLLLAVDFAYGIKLKKIIDCLPLPLFGAFVEVFLWSRRAFIAWKDIDEYALTLAIAAAFMMFLSFCKNRLRFEKAPKRIIFTLLDAFMFAALYELPLLIINFLFKGRANELALSVSYLLCALFLCLTALQTTKRLRNIQSKTVCAASGENPS